MAEGRASVAGGGAGAKGKKAPFREEFETQETWDAYMEKEGLKVVDAYADWCGPCRAVQSLFRRIKTDLGDKLLSFATANTDKIGTLKAYGGHSEPVFLFYAKNVLVNVVRGANGPLLERTIKGELENEHTVLKTGGVRKSIEDMPPPPPPVVEAKVEPRASSARPKSVSKKEYTLALIKPDGAAHTDDIFARIAEAHMHVRTQTETTLTREQAQDFYAEHRGKPFFDGLLDLMTSGPVVAMVLSGTHAVADWRKLIGPANPDKAKVDDPNCLRALYGSDGTRNAVHGSDSLASASREILFFFKEWAQENLTPEHTVLIVKHDVISHVGAVKEKLHASGLTVTQEESVTWSQQKAEDFVHVNDSAGDPAQLYGSPIHLFHVEGLGAVRAVLDLVGPASIERAKAHYPESLRAQYAVSDAQLSFYSSATVEAGAKDVQLCFEDKAAAPVGATVDAAEYPTLSALHRVSVETDSDLVDVPAEPAAPTLNAKPDFDPAAAAQALREALNGPNEQKIADILGHVTQEQRFALLEAYTAAHSRDLVADLKAELKGDFESLCVALLTPAADFDAQNLHHCLGVLSTNVAELSEFLAVRSPDKIAQVKAAYARLNEGSDVAAAIKQHTKGLAHAVLSGVLDGSKKYAPKLSLKSIKDRANAIAEAVGSLASESGPLCEALKTCMPVEIKAISEAFESQKGETLLAAIQKELKDEDEVVARTFLHCAESLPGHFARVLHRSMAGLGTNDRLLMRVVVTRCERDMALIKKEFEAQYNKTLAHYIKGDTSGDYEHLLLALIGEA